MSARPVPATGRAALEDELLAQLGLPASASPEDVDQLHQAVSDYLAAAPSSIRGWARTQVSALDAAYLKLTDPVGLEGSALRSPTRPPTVVPGGPATPPVRRGPAPEAAAPTTLVAAGGVDEDELAAIADEPDLEDLAALYASVTPSAHADMAPDRKVRRTTSQRQAVRRSAQAVSRVPVAPAGPNWWKRLTLAGAAIVAVAAIGFGANQVVNGGALTGGNGAASVAPSQQAPSVDESKVRALMQELQADPNNIDTLMALGDEYYFGTQYAVAGTWFTKILAIDANNVKALNAEGAVLYNTKDLAGAEATWKKTIAVDPSNVEAHFNLGFLYMNSQTPDFAGVQREWNEVIRLDPAGQFAQVAKAHLDSLVKASMIPAASGAPTGSGAPAGSPAASTSPAASAAPVASGSPAASASPAASTQP